MTLDQNHSEKSTTIAEILILQTKYFPTKQNIG